MKTHDNDIGLQRPEAAGAKDGLRSRLVVVGMHRSGTSAITEVLQSMGFYVGEASELTSPSWQNPRGFFERRDVREICDELLMGAGADWWKVSNFDPDSLNVDTVGRVMPRVREVFANLERHGAWVIKEPRLCLLLPVVVSEIRSPAAVIIVRHPAEVARSLRRRNGFPTFVGTALWEAYVVASLNATRNLPRTVVNYNELVRSPGTTISQLMLTLREMGLSPNNIEEKPTTIDSDLYREHAESTARSELSEPQLTLWEMVSHGPLPSDVVQVSQRALDILRQFEQDETERIQRRAEIKFLKSKVSEQKSQIQLQRDEFQSVELKLNETAARLKSVNSLIEKYKTKESTIIALMEKYKGEKSAAGVLVKKLRAQLEQSKAKMREMAKEVQRSRNKATRIEKELRKSTRRLDRTLGRRLQSAVVFVARALGGKPGRTKGTKVRPPAHKATAKKRSDGGPAPGLSPDLRNAANELTAKKDWPALIGLWTPILDDGANGPLRGFVDVVRATRLNGDLSAAELWVRKATSIHGLATKLAEEALFVALAKGDIQWAEQIWADVHSSSTEQLSVKAHLAMASNQRERGALAAAEATLNEGLARYPSAHSIVTGLATAAMDRNQWPQAESLWKRALTGADPGSPSAHRGLISSLRAQGRIGDAIVAARQALKAHPGSPSLSGLLEELELSQSEWIDAVSLWHERNANWLGTTTEPDKSGANQVVIYTCLFGAYEAPKRPLFRDPRVRWVLFTDDRRLVAPGWEVVLVREQLSSSRRTSRLPKMLPHIYLGSHDISLYIDASLEVKTPDLIASCSVMLGDSDIALYQHHARNSVHDEINFVEMEGLEDSRVCNWYRRLYETALAGNGDSLLENTLIVRKNTPQIKRLNEAWWTLYMRSGAQRDQLSLSAAIALSGVSIGTISQGKQVRDNPFVTFYKHHRPRLTYRKSRLFIFIAYAPSGYGRDLGRTYNEYMARLSDDDVAVFIDHDAMFCDTEWLERFASTIDRYSAQELVIFGRCNRIGNPYQRVNILADSHNIIDHKLVSRMLSKAYNDIYTHITAMPSASGVVFAITKRAWLKNRFAAGFLKVDNNLHLSMRKNGGEVRSADGLYVYHFYRADGDESHAAPIEKSHGDAPESEHFLRNVVYIDGQRVDIAAICSILRANEWLMLICTSAIFCTKDWYLECVSVLRGLSEDEVLVPSISTSTAGAPRQFDVGVHRAFAEQVRASTPKSDGPIRLNDLPGAGPIFAISRKMLEAVQAEQTETEFTPYEILTRAVNLGARITRANHAYALVADASQHEPLVSGQYDKIRTSLRNRRNIALLTLGFWPQQAGMEMFIHNLAEALVAAGDLVTLFAPHPQTDFTEIPHTYILRRFKGIDHLVDLFRSHHESIPFDGIIVQGAYKAAGLALNLREAFGVPVALRTHGEDIQVDEAIGYGYRLDPERAAVIERHIGDVDWNIAISNHAALDIYDLKPKSPVSVIGNGVNIERFKPERSRYLRDRLRISDQTVIILTVGRNVRKKSFHYAVQLLQELINNGCDVALVHVGKEGNGEPLRELSEKSGVSQRFYLMGEVSYFDMPLVYSGSDIFVFPSKMETFGNVTVEAMASGLPCVEFDYGANADKIDQGETGYIVSYGDVHQLAARVAELVKDLTLRKKMGDLARESVVKRFSWSAIAERYRDVIRHLSEQRPTTRRAIENLVWSQEYDRLVSQIPAWDGTVAH